MNVDSQSPEFPSVHVGDITVNVLSPLMTTANAGLQINGLYTETSIDRGSLFPDGIAYSSFIVGGRTTFAGENGSASAVAITSALEAQCSGLRMAGAEQTLLEFTFPDASGAQRIPVSRSDLESMYVSESMPLSAILRSVMELALTSYASSSWGTAPRLATDPTIASELARNVAVRIASVLSTSELQDQLFRACVSLAGPVMDTSVGVHALQLKAPLKIAVTLSEAAALYKSFYGAAHSLCIKSPVVLIINIL